MADDTGGFTRVAPASAGDTADGWARLKQAAAKPQEQTSVLDAVWEGLKRGGRDVLESGAQIGAKMMQAGPEAGAGAFDVPQQRQAAAASVAPAIAQAQRAFQQSPAAQQHPIASNIGRVGGNVAASAPLMAVPGASGAGTGMAVRSLLGAGLGGATGGPMGALAGGGMGAAGAAIGPPIAQQFQKIAQDYPTLMQMATGVLGRTPDAFRRSTANEVLSDLKQVVPPNIKTDEALINYAHDAVSDVYNKTLPKVTFRAADVNPETGESFTSMLPGIIEKVPEGHQKDFISLLEKEVTGKADPKTGLVKGGRLDTDGTMSGRAWKEADSAISQEAHYYRGSTQGADRKYLDALRELQGGMRETLAASADPADSDLLKAANSSWHKLVLLEEAAGRKVNSEFMPNDLLQVGRRETGNRRFARGQGVLNAYARAANDLLGGRPTNMQRLITDLSGVAVGGAAGAALGGPIGGAAGGVIGRDIGREAGPAIGGLVSGLRQKPGAREFGSAMSRSAPVAGAGEDRDSYVSPAGG